MSGLQFSDHEAWPAEAAVVDAGLDAFNAGSRLSDVRPLACLLRDARGGVIGGALGRTWGECAELQQLWVAEAHRGHGLGAALVYRFEAAATARGVQRVYLETFSFQAPGLYQRLGYAEVLRIAGYTGGVVKFTFLHELDAPDEPDVP